MFTENKCCVCGEEEMLKRYGKQRMICPSCFIHAKYDYLIIPELADPQRARKDKLPMETVIPEGI